MNHNPNEIASLIAIDFKTIRVHAKYDIHLTKITDDTKPYDWYVIAEWNNPEDPLIVGDTFTLALDDEAMQGAPLDTLFQVYSTNGARFMAMTLEEIVRQEQRLAKWKKN